MKMFPAIALTVAVLSTAAIAQTAPQVIPLWPNGAPGFEKRKDIPEEAKDYWVKRINNPSITVFLPPKEKANGAAVVIAPGGGFHELVFVNEGVKAAQFLNTIGVAAFVLKYRLPGEDGSVYTMDNVREDAYRAMRLVRSHAADWNIDTHRLGMMGFSAGGSVISLIAYKSGKGDSLAPDPIDRLNGRPDFQILAFPAGPEPKSIPSDAPPSFLIVANDDEYGCDKVTMAIFEKLRAAGVRTEARLPRPGQTRLQHRRAPQPAHRHALARRPGLLDA